MFYSNWILVFSLCLFLFSCASPDPRGPAQTLQAEPEIPIAQRMNFVNVSSYVKVPGPNLSKSELAPYIKQCHTQMVDKMLDFSERLQKIKNYSGKNIQIGPLRLTKLNSVTAVSLKYTSWNFKFSVQDSNNMKYDGHIYTSTVIGLPKIREHHDGTYEYQCQADHDGWVFDAARLEDSQGHIVFSSSCAKKMLQGENIDERCENK